VSNTSFDAWAGRTLKRVSTLALALGFAVMAPWAAGQASAQATGTVTGTVTNATTGASIAGAQISIVGTQLGTLTNNVGRFIVLNVPAGTHTVRAEFIGYGAVEQEVNVTAGGSIVVDFGLRSEAISLEGVVVTGTAGAARRREIGNSISQVDAAAIENQPVTNVGDILQGRAAGVTIMDNGGSPGTGRTIRLRGNNSVSQGNQPLIYVDGLRINNDAYPGDPENNQAANPLDDIRPEDIERVEVVKGAAATTLYGTEAAGGVIQIFTKRGASGAPAWNFSMDLGMNNMGHVGPDEDVNPTGLWLNDCTYFTDPNDPDDVQPGCPESGSWLSNGFIQNYALSVRGGNDRVNYFLSGTWGDEEGVLPNQGQRQYSARGNFGFSVSENLNFRFNTAYTHRQISWVPDGNNAEGLLLNVMRGWRDYTPDHDDSFVLDMELENIIDHFTTGLNMVWTTGSLTHRVNAGLDWSTADYAEERPWEFFYVPLGNRETEQWTTRKLTFDYSGAWDADFGSSFSNQLSFGAQIFDDFINSTNGFGYDFAGPGDKEVDSGARTEAFETRRYKTTGGFFVQDMFGISDLLFITAGLRLDGHSAFGEDFGWAPYPKISAAWVISDHQWFPESLGSMRIRSAYGESGKAPGFFDSERTWDAVSGDDAQPAVTPANVGNPELGPERTAEIEAGFEGALWDGRFTYEYTYYTQNTSDALIPVTQTPSNGFVGTQLENVGEINNQGHELFLNFNLWQSENWTWDLGGRLATNKSEVKDLGGLESISLGWRNYVRPGEPLPVYCHDVVQNGDEVGAIPEFDEECLGSSYPTRNFGLNTSLTFARRLTLDVLGEGQSGHVLNSGTAYQNVRRGVWPPCLDIKAKIDAGDTANLTAYERAKCDSKYVTYGMWTEAADFFKLRSVSLSYRIPDNLLPGSIRGATLRLQGRNLWVSTDYPGLDPETFEDGSRDELFRQEYYNIPPSRRFLFSLKIDF
jgi:TonB-dependent SusC/RagA subfamily outer membrane receptor